MIAVEQFFLPQITSRRGDALINVQTIANTVVFRWWTAKDKEEYKFTNCHGMKMKAFVVGSWVTVSFEVKEAFMSFDFAKKTSLMIVVLLVFNSKSNKKR